LIAFSGKKNYKSAQKYLDNKLCERLEAGTKLKVINPAEHGSLIVKPEGRSIHLFISSSISKQ